MIDILQTRSSGATACVSPLTTTSPNFIEKLTLRIDKPGAMLPRRHCRRDDGPHDYQPGIYLDLRDAGGHLRLHAARHVHTDEDWAQVAAPKRQAGHVTKHYVEKRKVRTQLYFNHLIMHLPGSLLHQTVACQNRFPRASQICLIGPDLPWYIDHMDRGCSPHLMTSVMPYI